MLLAGLLLAQSGCEGPPEPIKTHPPNALRVMYEEATSHRTCLVASVAMAANYLLDERQFTEQNLVEALHKTGRDETSIRDMKAHLLEQGLHLLALKGTLDAEPPTGLGYWLSRRGYPVICVINRENDSPGYNHAVVVIGISSNPDEPGTDMIQYLDPGWGLPLHVAAEQEFDRLWRRGDYAMMVVVQPPD
jgi:hypothetical protein